MKTLGEAVKMAQFRALGERQDLYIYLLGDGTFAARSLQQIQMQSPSSYVGALRVAEVHRTINLDKRGGWDTRVEYHI